MLKTTYMKPGIITFIIISLIGLAFVLYVQYSKKDTNNGTARFYYLITDNGEVNYSMENSQGLIVTQLADDSIRVVQPDGMAYLFRNDVLLETADISPFKVMDVVRRCADDGSMESVTREVMDDGSEIIKAEIQGVKDIRGFYNLISPVYSDTQVHILNNMLKARGTDKAVLEFDMLSSSEGLVYMSINYRIGGSVFNVWRVEGRYVKEIDDWSLGFNWSDIDVSSISDDELTAYVDRLVQVVNDVAAKNLNIEQLSNKGE